MRVGLELTGLELDRGGLARYAPALAAELEERLDVDLVRLAQPGLRRAGKRGRLTRGLVRELAYLPVLLPLQARRRAFTLLHCPMALAPLAPSVPTIITVPDVMTWHHPGWFSRANVLEQRVMLARAMRRATVVITCSEFSRRQILDLFDLEPDRVQSIPLGIDHERFRPGPAPDGLLDRLGVARPYILTVGTMQPRKNLESALLAFERLASELPDHALVVAGARGWRDASILRRMAESAAAERIHFIGRISDEDLVGLYRSADCFLFTSRYEGFGFPPLEAMACGAPVVSSDRTSLPEVVGEAAVLVDPDDIDGIERAVAKVLASPEERAELSRRGRAQASGFTWGRCADQTVAAYRWALEHG
jgi:glycosyltransferase involved in cell wall biosynthesis